MDGNAEMIVRQADLVEKTETWTAFVCGCGYQWARGHPWVRGLLIAVGFSQLSTIPQLLFEPALGVYPVISRWMPIVLDGKYAISML